MTLKGTHPAKGSLVQKTSVCRHPSEEAAPFPLSFLLLRDGKCCAGLRIHGKILTLCKEQAQKGYWERLGLGLWL